MLIPVGIENNNDDRSIAWALEHAGCFAYGRDAAEAGANMPGAVEEYAGWARRHGMKWMGDGPLEIFVEETFDDYRLKPTFKGVEIRSSGKRVRYAHPPCDERPDGEHNKGERHASR